MEQFSILLVDDSPEDRINIRQLLSQATNFNYIITEANTVKEALRLCKSTQPDCMLLNHQLPDVSGLELLTQFRAPLSDCADVPIIFIIDDDPEKTALEAIKKGAQDYINKNDLTYEKLHIAIGNAIENMRLQVELTQSEDRYRALVEATEQIIWSADGQGEATFATAAWQKLTGQTHAEMRGHGWMNTIHPDDREHAANVWINAVEMKKSFFDEYRVRGADGTYHDVEVRGVPILNADGSVREWAGVSIDVSHRKAVERELKQTNERFELATAAVRGLIYDTDVTNQSVFRSPGMSTIIGYHPDEVPTSIDWWFEQIHPDDLERIETLFSNTVSSRMPWQNVEYRVRHKDGHYVWVWDNCAYIYNADGQLTRMVGGTMSINENKTLVEALAKSEEQFRVTFENATDAMAISDSQGIVIAANNAYFELYGYTAEEVIGHEFSIIFPAEARAFANEQYQQVFAHQLEQPAYEATIQRKDGSIRHVEARVGFVEPNGQRLYMLSVVRDFTERKQAEDSLQARYNITSALAQAITVEAVAKVTVDYVMSHLGAKAGNIFFYHPEDDTFEMLYTSSQLSPEQLAPWQRFPADPSYPGTDVLKQGKSLWFSTAEEREAAYPSTKQFRPLAIGASVMLPLIAGAQIIGITGLTFSEERVFTENERLFISSLIFQCAQAMERARLAEKEKEMAVIQERNRLARDLHDTVSQLLFSSSMTSELLPRFIKTKPERAIEQAEHLNFMVRGAMAEMRTLLWELRPESILQTELTNLIFQIAEVAKVRQEIAISIKARGTDGLILPPDAQVAFYRIAQESVHNVLKNSQATAVSLYVRKTRHYVALALVDNGRGFESTAISSGIGQKSMRERADAIGALFDVKSKIGKGTRVRLLWTLDS